MPYKEKRVTKQYYTIGEVAKVIDEPVSTVRFWEDEFGFVQPKKNQKGRRQFTQDDLRKLKMIRYLMKEKLYTIQGAKNFLKNNLDDNMAKLHWIDSLKKIKTFLVELQEQL